MYIDLPPAATALVSALAPTVGDGPAKVPGVARCYMTTGNPYLEFSEFGLTVRLTWDDEVAASDADDAPVVYETQTTVWHCRSVRECREVFAREHLRLSAGGAVKYADEPQA